MDWTDRHCRYFLRQLSPHAKLYTEMITAPALLHGDTEKLLRFDAAEHPVALQLGGSDPDSMADAARLGAAAGYDEININVGCPSDRVQSGAFGACLMAAPRQVADCVSAMREAVDIPVTVKTRIGIDDSDSEEFFRTFIGTVAAAGCRTFIVHARVAMLEGLSPKENRSVPPLNYPRVYALKRDRPELTVILNGGVTSIDQCRAHLRRVDGVMIGRQAYQHPWLLAELEAELGGPGAPPASRTEVAARMIDYVEREIARGCAAQAHYPAHAGPLRRPARCSRVATLSQRECAPRWCRRERPASRARTVARCRMRMCRHHIVTTNCLACIGMDRYTRRPTHDDGVLTLLEQ